MGVGIVPADSQRENRQPGPEPTRFAFFGDLHGNEAATQSVLEDIDGTGVDALVCLGDLVGYGAHPNETIDLVHHRHIPTLMGNYDDGVGYDRDICGCAYRDEAERERGQASLVWTQAVVTADRKQWLRSLRFDHRLDAGAVRIRAVHGSPRQANEYLFEDRDPASLERIAQQADCDVLVFGHSHKPWSRRVAGVLLVNAGSVGKPKDGNPAACWVLLTVSGIGGAEVEFRRVPHDVGVEAAAIRAADGLPDQFARDIETGGTP